MIIEIGRARKTHLIIAGNLGAHSMRLVERIKQDQRLALTIAHNPNIFLEHSLGADFRYDAGKAERFFSEHLAYYLEEVRRAKETSAFPLLITGEDHQASAPYLVALKRVFGLELGAVAYDRHSDCYSRRLDKGGFWPWLIDRGELRGERLSILGVAMPATVLERAEYLPPKIKDGITALAEKGATDPEADLDYEYFSGPTNLLVAELIPDQSALETLFPGGAPGAYPGLIRRYSLAEEEDLVIKAREQLCELIIKYCKEYKERVIITRAGISLGSDLRQPGRLPAFGEDTLLSLDTDISSARGFSLALLDGSLAQLQQANVIGAHVEELESPVTTIRGGDIDLLAEQVINRIILRLSYPTGA